MRLGKCRIGIIGLVILLACEQKQEKLPVVFTSGDSLAAYADGTAVEEADTAPMPDSLPKPMLPSDFSGGRIDTRGVPPDQVVAFAQTLIGTRYCYASTDPAAGFDCSGFITYVFQHFGIAVPRSSVDFTNVEQEIALQEARSGDLVLFTGTDSTKQVVGHMGLVVKNENGLVEFIHSSSGKANGVTISPVAAYYRSRYVKTIRIFPTGTR